MVANFLRPKEDLKCVTQWSRKNIEIRFDRVMQHNGVCARHFNPISMREDNELYFLERRFSRGSKVQSATTTRSLDLKIFVSREQTLRKGGGKTGSGGCVWALDSNGSRRLAGSESSWNVDLKRKGNGTPAAPI